MWPRRAEMRAELRNEVRAERVDEVASEPNSGG
jgi:hypothetical protein